MNSQVALLRLDKGYGLEDISIVCERPFTWCQRREYSDDAEYRKLIEKLPPKNLLLYEKRIEKGMTIEEVAQFCGRNVSTIERWERGGYSMHGERGGRLWVECFYPKSKANESYAHTVAICWNCARVGKGTCSWDRALIPVEGCTQKTLKSGYRVTVKCPLFEKEKRK